MTRAVSAESLPLRPATVGCVFNKIWKRKLISSYVLVLGDIDIYSCGLPISLPVTVNTVSQCPLSTYTGHAVFELILNALKHSNAVLCQIIVKKQISDLVSST